MEYLKKLSKDMVLRLHKKYIESTLEDCEDAVQDSMVKYLEKHGNLDRITPQWLWTAATRRLVDLYRHNHRSIQGVPEQSEMSDGTTYIDISIDSCREYIKNTAQQLAYPK